MEWFSLDQFVFSCGLLLAVAGSLSPLVSTISGARSGVASWRRLSLWIALVGVAGIFWVGWNEVPTVEQIGRLVAHYPWTARLTLLMLAVCALSSAARGGRAVLAVAMFGVFGVSAKAAGVLWPQGGEWLIGGVAIAYAAAWFVGAAYVGVAGARKHVGVIGAAAKEIRDQA